MTTPVSICLISPGHLASTPRLVKAADALNGAGYRVHVVAGRHFPPAEPLDAAILGRARWTCTRVTAYDGCAGLLRRGLRLLARQRLAAHPAAIRWAARAQHAGSGALAAAAAAVPAAFYFGHGGVAGLGAAAEAARRRRVGYGFDVEDWHEEESEPATQHPGERIAVARLLRAWLPGARVLTCAAPRIAARLAECHGVSAVPILNVFPLALAPAAPLKPVPATDDEPAQLYWFSQTIGPGRGLEGLLTVVGRMRTPAVLHARGFVSDAYRAALSAHAQASGARTPVFLPPAAPDEMVRLAAGAHLGLSLEQSRPVNRDLCLTNKIFTYLLAGVPVALTPTTAQRELAPQLGAAAVPLDLGAPARTAAHLDHWLAHDRAVAAATAWRLGRERYHWEHEQEILIELFHDRLPRLP